MASKYRIVYDASPRYQNHLIFNRLKPYFLPLLLSTILCLCLLLSSDPSKYYHLMLPGDPTVTADALQQLSDSIKNGESFPDSLEVFCEAIMAVR